MKELKLKQTTGKTRLRYFLWFIWTEVEIRVRHYPWAASCEMDFIKETFVWRLVL